MFPSNQLDTPDFTPIVVRKKEEKTQSNGYKGHGLSSTIKVEKQADEGNFVIKRYDPSLIKQVVSLRTKLGMKQEDFAKKYGVPLADLKAFEKNTPPYNPNLVSKIKTILTKTNN